MPPDDRITAADPGRNLPPVRPPSGRFIAQLFLVPGLIVFFVLLLVLAVHYMFVGGQSPDQLLRKLDDANPDIRWRGANDLAQSLKRPENISLRTNVGFALDLCERLDKALKALEEEERTLGEALQKDKNTTPEKLFRKLEPQRNLVSFLAAALAEFQFPAGVPLLCEIVGNDTSPDVVYAPLRRPPAVWALANLGNNIKNFKSLRGDHQSLILATLRTEEKSDHDVRRKAAKNALFYLNEFPDAKDAELVSVDQVFDKASRSPNQFLREMVAIALNFWDGPLAEETLLRLSRDDGFGAIVKGPDEP
jgi:hypothetical protein